MLPRTAVTGASWAETIEDFGCAYVAGVHDVLRATQRIERFGAQQAVRVANDANEHNEIIRGLTRMRGAISTSLNAEQKCNT